MTEKMHKNEQPGGLYRPEFERDNCGFGLIAQMDDQPSHQLVQTSIKALSRLTHRGAVSADGKTGDGCGLLMKKPEAFLREIAAREGLTLSDEFAVGVVFLNTDEALAAAAREVVEAEIVAAGLEIAGWRTVPVNPDACGDMARACLPLIEQILVNLPDGLGNTEAETALFVARRRAEKKLAGKDPVFYIPSLSTRVLSYKGLVMPDHLAGFYLDLAEPSLASSLCIFHQRFSTNTWPQWRLAQPFRMLAHNGEINTIRGNRNWAQARAHIFQSPTLPDLSEFSPLVSMDGSDSSSMDNMLEIMVAGGLDIFRAMRLLIPPSWQNVEDMEPELRAFYEYNSMHMEPWDGPAGVVLTDGRHAACCLDRNGLRPARYVITRDRQITLASEIGVYDYAPEDVVDKGRLTPGQMLAVDLENGRLLLPSDIDRDLQSRQPYLQWMDKYARRFKTSMSGEILTSQPLDATQLVCYEKLFNLSYEERTEVLRPTAEAGQEAVGSMGDDTPMPVLSTQQRSLYDSFRQQFAQVTNPAIDPLREAIVMSLETCLGAELNLFDEKPEYAGRLAIDTPCLTESRFQEILSLDLPEYNHQLIDLNRPLEDDLEASLKAIADEAEQAVRAGVSMLVLSDRAITRDSMPVHALLATGAVHHRLISKGIRCNTNVIVETGTTRDSHHFACLIGFGATAVYPYLAYESLHGMLLREEIQGIPAERVAAAYVKGIGKGLYKIMSKMGISTIASYRGSQLFEIVGLGKSVVELCFRGTVSRIQGIDFSDLQADQLALCKLAWNPRKPLQQGGLLKFVHGGEYHAYNPDVVATMHTAVTSGDYADWQKHTEVVDQRPPMVIRDLFRLRSDRDPIPLEEVEPVEDIIRRFDSAGMSLGALSPEAHETLAQAMNRLGARSNSGEGGEDPARYGTDRVSKIKQIASGRFGVTPHYLVNAEVLQIKVAQGAKPGEGGQLPGGKVNDMIARLRYSSPGVSLISPPPHHDIYSIEDLSQLIFDLKQVNPLALVSVKLVSEAGVGTIAAGVAKAYADLITISGYDGGTAASPLTSVKYAGSPWELGLTETHQALRANDLRDKVRLQADGGMKTGLDVIKAAILGAESFGFGTGPMIAMGCKYLRICHLNNCATGVATQDNVLRLKHYVGDVDRVINYFRFIAEDVRHYMASIGVRRLEELIGQVNLLEVIEGKTERQRRLDFSEILTDAGIDAAKPHFCIEPHNEPYDKGELAEQMVADMLPAIEAASGGEFSYRVQNINRSIGARISGEIARRHGNYGMCDNPVTLRLTGTAGQSFGVWNAGGLDIYLEGDANDYVGKGMAAGKIIIRPPAGSTFRSQETTIIGNTCLYGATGGKLYASGQAGERFAVRNSGATAIVEGIGDHGCEYMTGGVIVVLGRTGVNFGAGMTGGFAYVLDRDHCFSDRYNHELIDIHRLTTAPMEAHREHLRGLLQEYVEETGSEHARSLLEDFRVSVDDMWLVKPKASDLDALLSHLRSAA